MTSLPNTLNTAFRGVRFLSRVVRQDLSNLFAHGFRTPRMHERIWVDPRQCEMMSGEFHWDDFGKILGDDWDTRSSPLGEEPTSRDGLVHWLKIQACLRHWIEGMSWESTGIYDHLLQLIEDGGTTDGCDSLDDIVRRYQRLDEVFIAVSRSKKLSTRAELSRIHFREVGGVVFHIDRDLRPVFGLWGCHRFAMAIAADLPVIPAQVGVVHAEVKDSWRNHFSSRAWRETTTI